MIEDLKVDQSAGQGFGHVGCPPVVPGIGVIAVGLPKPAPTIINLSGYDGGTGAARKLSLQYVGLPAEFGVHSGPSATLVEAGLLHKDGIWCDGGIKPAKTWSR